MKHQFTDLIPLSDLKAILDSFFSTNGIPSEIVNEEGLSLFGSALHDMFTISRKNDDSSNRWYWIEEEGFQSQSANLPIKRFSYSCKLFKYTINIRVGNDDIATLILGPLFHITPGEEVFAQLAQDCGVMNANCLENFHTLPVISEEQTKNYLLLLAQIIQQLAEKGFNELLLRKALTKAQAHQKKLEISQNKLRASIEKRTEELEQVNAALQESEQRFRVALVDTPIMIFIQDLDLRYTWVYNAQYFSEKMIVGKTDAELFSPEVAIRLTTLKNRVIAVGLLTREEVEISVGGQVFIYDMTLDPLYDASGAVIGLTCAAADITKQKQIEDQLRRTLTEIEGLQKISQGLLQKTGLDDVLEIVCVEAMHLTGAGGSAVLLLDNEGALRLTHRAGSPEYDLDCLSVEGSFAGRAIQTGSHVWVNRQGSDQSDESGQWQGFPWTPGLQSMLSVPLKVDEQVIGVLNILDKHGEITEEDIRIISLFADQASIIIEHIRLQRQSEQVAILEERQNLARELHDSVTQALYSVTLYADAARMAFTAKKWHALEQNLQEVRKMAREAMYDMRLLVFELRPLMLEKDGLAVALRSRLSAVEGRTGLKTEVLVEGERRLPIEIEEEIYQIAQEGLNNVIKHAKASEIRIFIKYTTENVTLEVIDDGIGFDPQKEQTNGGVGLIGIGERVKKLGGSLKIETASGNGTRIIVTIPN